MSELNKIDELVNKILKTIEDSKKEANDITISQKSEYRKLEEELKVLKLQTSTILEEVSELQTKTNESKRQLIRSSKLFNEYTEEEIRDIYTQTEKLIKELATKQEQERSYIKRRNELEILLKKKRSVSLLRLII